MTGEYSCSKNKESENGPEIKPDFKGDLKKCENADLIYWYNEMLQNDMSGAVEDIKAEMIDRFLATDWTRIKELLEKNNEAE